MDKLLEGLLVKAYNKTPEEISELLFTNSDDSDEVVPREDAVDLLLDLDAQRVSEIKSNTKPDKETIKNLRDQMRSEVLSDFESKIKAQYSIESDKKGLELINEAVQQASECDISDDKIKQHPVFLEMENKLTDELDKLREEHEQYKLNQDKRSRFTRVERDVLGVLSSLNPIESPTASVAQNRRSDFLRKFEPYDYEVKDDGDHFVMKDGKRVEDKHGHPVKFKDFVKSKASEYYDFEQSAGSNAGNKDGKQSSTVVPKDEKEYFSQMAELMAKNDKEGVIKLREAWNAVAKS